MRVNVLLPGLLRRWHLELLERIATRADTCVRADPDPEQAPPKTIDRLFQMETWLHGLSSAGLWSPLSASEIARFRRKTQLPADVVLDLRDDSPLANRGALRVTYDGMAGETALMAAILERRTPLVEVLGADGAIAAGRPGTEHGGVVRATFEDMLARISTLILAALDASASRVVPDLPADGEPPGRAAPSANVNLPKVVARGIARKIVRGVYHLGFHSPHWRVGWRKCLGPDVIDLRRHPESGWSDLPDDGRRFYADPFPIAHRGQVTLFVEEFEHRLGKGIISAVEIGPDGPRGVPIPVLEQPGHLSYPFVFEREGSFWMIPETNSAGRIDLFRSTDFPGGWVHEATLISGVVASDATLVERDGLWWMFATVRDGGGAYSDALHLWSAPDFRGPWTAHPRNPVLIDIASARPAGRMVERDGILYRPVQDCRNGYGDALGIARVDRLDLDGFAQTVETILRAGPKWPGRRLHTLNSAGGFEFIDGSAMAPRWRLRRGRLTSRSA